MSNFCIGCGAKAIAGASFCAGCGLPTYQPSQARATSESSPAAEHRETPPPAATVPEAVATDTIPATSAGGKRDTDAATGDAAGPGTHAPSAPGRSTGLLDAGRGWLANAAATPRPGDAAGEPDGGGPGRVSGRRMYVAFGLFALALFMPGQVASGFLAGAIFFAGFVVTALLVLDRFVPYPRPFSWMGRPRLGAVASVVYALVGAMAFGLGFSNVLWIAGAVLFISDARRRGELGNFDPRLLLRGARLLLVFGVAAASLVFLGAWNAETAVDNTYRSDVGDGDGYVIETEAEYGMGGENAYDRGESTVPSLLMLSALVWASWTGTAPAARRWTMRLALLGIAALLALWSVWKVVGSYLQAAGVEGHIFGSSSYGTISSVFYQAWGPIFFAIALLPFYLGVLVLTLRRDLWPTDPGS